MKGFTIASAVVAAAGLASTAFAQNTNPVDPIVIKGSKFFYKTNGTQFFMRGVAYQQDYAGNNTETDTGSSLGYVDPLADVAACQRDIPILKQLETNVIRVYSVDPNADHTQCMQMLNDAGIYVISDLSSPSESIQSNDPVWNDNLYGRYTSVVDALANYTNVLGFFAGNEVSALPNETDAQPFVKAAVRDTKAYIKSKNYRSIGVGYATADDEAIRGYLPLFLNCGTDQDAAVDFFGYNIYSWCGNSSYSESGYEARTEFFSNYSVPVFFAEYGCNTVTRTFTEVGALYGSQMTPVWSGGIVYMYFQEANDFGLVSVSGNTASKLPDFTVLSSQIKASATPTGVNMASYSPSNTPAACPSNNVNWTAAATPLPPSPNNELCSCMVNSVSCAGSSKITEENAGDLISTVCGSGSQYFGGGFCNGISSNGSTGTYGAYSMCNVTQQLNFVLNQYYKNSKSSASACAWSSSATLKQAASATGVCSALLQQAGNAGTGTVTSVPSGTGAGAAASESGGSGSGGSSASTSKGAASAIDMHHVNVGLISIGFYVFVAALSGAAMILL